MKSKHKKVKIFLAILVSLSLPILSAYICSRNPAESDVLPKSSSLENPGRERLVISRLFKVFSYFFAQAPSLNPGAAILRC